MPNLPKAHPHQGLPEAYETRLNGLFGSGKTFPPIAFEPAAGNEPEAVEKPALQSYLKPSHSLQPLHPGPGPKLFIPLHKSFPEDFTPSNFLKALKNAKTNRTIF